MSTLYFYIRYVINTNIYRELTAGPAEIILYHLPMADTRIDPITVYKIIGGRIRDERRKHELTQDELASRVGLKRTSITNVEKGKQKLLVHTLVDIARSLGTSPAKFFTALDAEAPLALPDDLSTSVRNWIVHSVTRPGRAQQR